LGGADNRKEDNDMKLSGLFSTGTLAKAVLAALLVFGLALTGCGDNGGGGGGNEDLKAPAAPGKPVITAAEEQLTASWEAVSNADSYEAMIDSVPPAHHEVKSTDKTSVTFTGLTNDTEYTVKVRAKNTVGTSEYSEDATGTPIAATEAPAAPSAPTATAEYNAITVSWTGVAGATKYQVWYGTSDSSSSATKYGDDITSGLSATITVTTTGQYYVWVKAGNSIGYSDFSPPATATVTALDPVIGTWYSSGETWEFKDNGAVEIRGEYVDDNGQNQSYTGNYTYDSTTNRIYYTYGTPPGLYGTYAVSGDKLTITRTYSDSYERQGTGSGLTGTWRRGSGDYTSYTEYTFPSASAGKVTETYVSGNEDDSDTYEYDYTVSGNNKITMTLEQHIATLEGDTLNEYMGKTPTLFTRKGSGSGVVGTWEAGTGGDKVTVVITTSTLTYTAGGQTEQMPCRIDGNDLYVVYSWECTYSIDTTVTPQVLTLTEERTDEYTRKD
jgi:hypothetical protein